MNKKIIALLLAVVTVFSAFPLYSLPLSAESVESEKKEEGKYEVVDPANMVVDKLYSAFFKDDALSLDIYKDSGAAESYGEKIEKKRLPELLTVKLCEKDDRCVNVLNKDWPEYLDGYRYLDHRDLVIIERIETDEGYIIDKVEISGENVADGAVILCGNAEEIVIADVESDIEDSARYQWQAKLTDGRWANISGYINTYATLKKALLINVADGDTAFVRCLVTSGDKTYVSRELTVVLRERADVNVQNSAEGGSTVPVSDGVYYEVTREGTLKLNSTEVTEPKESTEGGGNAEGGSDQSGTENGGTSAESTFQIVITYRFRHQNPSSLIVTTDGGRLDGAKAANTFTVTLPTGGFYSGTIATPLEEGYLPYVRVEQARYVTPGTSSDTVITYDGVNYVAANSISFEKAIKGEHVEVYYIPQIISYTVKVYEQNLYNDEYSLAATRTESGYASAAVGRDLNTVRYGFTAKDYEVNTPINEDGTTVIEIYYERVYFSVSYNLVDALANGATPHLVRYNTPVMLPQPSLKGYDFVKWTLTEVTTVTYKNSGELNTEKPIVTDHTYESPSAAGTLVNVCHNLSYRAGWKEAATTYTIVYWLEKTNSTDSAAKTSYNVWYTHKMTTVTGQKTIAGSDNIKTHVTSANGFSQTAISDVTSTYPYLEYKASLTDTTAKTTVGDGTTTINIYYSRKSYTLKFYYAIEKTSGNSSTYHVIGGSTYYFGSNAPSSGNARTDEIAAMRQYASGSYTSQTGQVKVLPTLNAKGIARNYTVSTDTDGTNKYHYISFTAKYGADLTDLWPCDVFNSATRSSSNTHGSWSGNQAFVSAWNGEYRVRYTQDSSVNNGNQTIKGKYTVLDQNLLWNSTSVTDTTVTYACFWENGANINWSVPELYRYNIYLPLLPGQDETGLTIRTHNGTRYYLADQYDTCDDSTTAAQTQPGLVGFTSNGKEWATITSYNTSLYKEAYDMFYYYSRNIYHLSFNDMHGSTVVLTVPYGTLIGDHDESAHTPIYPSDLEEGECAFGGWYYDESCTIEFHHNTKMPAENIQLYAKWVKLTYTVEIYYDDGKTALAQTYNAVPFGTFVVEPQHETWQSQQDAYKNMIFTGWYYKSGDEDVRFDFNTMVIKGNMVFYAKWTSKDLID